MSKIKYNKKLHWSVTFDYLAPQKSVEDFEKLFSNLNIVKVAGSHFILQSKPVECGKVVEFVI